MGKNVQIILLVCVFAVCGVGGWFLGGLVSDKPEPQPVEEVVAPVVEPEPVRSTVPVISDEPIVPKRDAAGKYSFNVTASVESGDDALIYVLYSDEGCTAEVTRNLNGQFTGIPATASAKYYVCVKNAKTDSMSIVKPVDGFRQIVMYQKITKEEIERICNTVDFTTAGHNTFVHRTSNLKLVPIGMNSGERAVETISDVCNKIMTDKWKSIEVEDITYDGQNRMTKLTFKVNYPEQ